MNMLACINITYYYNYSIKDDQYNYTLYFVAEKTLDRPKLLLTGIYFSCGLFLHFLSILSFFIFCVETCYQILYSTNFAYVV